MTKKTVDDILERKARYKEDILSLLEKKEKKIAYHFNCPDGIISAALFRYLFSLENLTYIPLDYVLLKEEEMENKLSNADWFGILDFEPFNKNRINYFFDHHISNVDKKINAEHFLFDSGAPSAASLIANFFENLLPDYLVDLSKMTEITDTASYKIPPPTEIKENFMELSWDEKIWFLEDVCKTIFTVSEHNEIVEILAKKGLEGIWNNYNLNRVGKVRESRRISLKIVESIDINDFVIILDKPVNFHIAFIAGEVMKRGAKGAAYITDYPDETKVSLRLSKSLNAKKVNKYRVDLLAKTMGGGGHKPASGAETKDVESALKKIETWAKMKKLKLSHIDLREKEKEDYF